MSLDTSFAVAKILCNDVQKRSEEIKTEQDARVQIINRFLTEVLSWNFEEIKTETYSEAGYADYLISSDGRSRLVVEAKRIGSPILDTTNDEMANYVVGGPALVSAMPGIRQAAAYCLDHGAGYAALTTGLTWIVFLPFPLAGIPYTKGKAFVFPSPDSILKDFATFYDLLSREGVTNRHYDLHFAKASGVTAEAFEPMTAANRNEYLRLLPATQLATDLEPVFRGFFGGLSGQNDPEMMTDCFVETRESRYADASLEKIVRSISASISTLEPDTKNQLALEIKHAVESGHGETVVIVGNDGSGKSTFMDRFFKSVLDTPVREKCVVVKIDISRWSGDLTSLSTWLTKEIKARLEMAMYSDGMPSYEELQGLYWREYQSWMKGQFKPLYESDKLAFKIKFGNFVGDEITRDPYSYIIRILDDVVRNRRMLPCLVFDNSDSFEPISQEVILQFSQSMRENVPFTFIVVPVTDKSFWRLSKSKTFQKIASKMFYLPVPPTKDVLEKRVEFLKRKIENAKTEHSYFLSKGIKLTVENIRGFAACIEEIFIREDFVSRRISWLSNNNLQKCLVLAQTIILSPIFSVDDLVKAYLGRDAVINVNYRKFMQALLHGNYNAFQQDHNNYVRNVFAVSPKFPTSPLLTVSILKMLIESSQVGESALDGYLSIEQINRYFVAAGVSEAAIDSTLEMLLTAKLIQPYDSSRDDVDDKERVAITHSGRIHYEMATVDQFYVSDMAFATPLRSLDAVESLRSLRDANAKMTWQSWKSAQRIFFVYILEQDELFFRLPKDAIYDNQRLLRQELRGRWIEDRLGQPVDTEVQPVPTAELESFSQRQAVVSWYNSERGYGFAEAGLSQSVFIHRSVLEQSGIDVLRKGDQIVCDIAPVPKGKLEAIAIHSVLGPITEVGTDNSWVISGVIVYWNQEKGYGFVGADNLPEDAYISKRTGDGKFADKLRLDARVRATVERGRFDKLAVTSIEMVD